MNFKQLNQRFMFALALLLLVSCSCPVSALQGSSNPKQLRSLSTAFTSRSHHTFNIPKLPSSVLFSTRHQDATIEAGDDFSPASTACKSSVKQSLRQLASSIKRKSLDIIHTVPVQKVLHARRHRAADSHQRPKGRSVRMVASLLAVSFSALLIKPARVLAMAGGMGGSKGTVLPMSQ